MIDLKLIPDGGLGWLDASGPMAQSIVDAALGVSASQDKAIK